MMCQQCSFNNTRQSDTMATMTAEKSQLCRLWSNHNGDSIRDQYRLSRNRARAVHNDNLQLKVILFTVIASIFLGIACASQQQVASIKLRIESDSILSSTRQQQHLNATMKSDTTSKTTARNDNFMTSPSSIIELNALPNASASTAVPSPSSTTSASGTNSSTMRNADDLLPSPSSISSSVNGGSSQQQVPVRRSSASGGNRWTHFGARLRPLATSGGLASTTDHHESAASSAKSSQATMAGGGGGGGGLAGRPRADGHGPQAGSMPAGRALNGNSLDGSGDSSRGNNDRDAGNNIDAADDEDEDDGEQDSEALLYKMMQQQNFLINPIWQEQPSGSAVNQDARQRQPYLETNGAALQQQRRNEDLSNSKKVIKLLKSYSHIHQVDDSDDQIRGTYTRLSSYRPDKQARHFASQNGRQTGAGNQAAAAVNSNRRGQQHIFVSLLPAAASQTSGQARIQPPQQRRQPSRAFARQEPVKPRQQRPTGDGQLDSHDGHPEADESSEGGGSEQNGGPPAPEEEEFECPNNGIFADVASGCQSYHVCQSGAQVQEKFQCPLGTLFNDIILTCDFAHNVQCGGTKRQATEGSVPAAQLQTQPQRAAAPGPLRPQAAQSANQKQQQRAQQHNGAAPHSGPRQLVIGSGNGGSPYNRHNQQQAPNQAQALGAYPAVKPLSNAINGGERGAERDADEGEDDAEPIEPLTPATLPPRPMAMDSRASLPYKAPPAAISAFNTKPVSIQQQIPHQANRQSAHLSQYPAMTARAQQQQLNQIAPPRYQGPRPSLDSATSSSPVFAEPTSQVAPTEPSVRTSMPQIHTNDAQSFDLVINHLTPTHSNSKQEDVQQRLQHAQQAAASVGRPGATHSELTNQNFVSPQGTPVYKSIAKQPEQGRVVVKQQRLSNVPLAAAGPAALQQNQAHNVRTPAPLDRYEGRRELASRQQQQQPRQPARLAGDARDNFAGATGASQQAAVSHAPPPPRGVVDLTNDKQATVGSAAMNDGLLLIVRHTSGFSPAHSANFRPVGSGAGSRHDGSANLNNKARQYEAGQAYAVDPTLVRPDSPLDAQLFPNVQQLIASSAGPVTQASSIRVQHNSPQSASTGQAAASRSRGPLPPMEPPRPVVDHKPPPTMATTNQQRQDYNRGFGDQSSGADQLASFASNSAVATVASGPATGGGTSANKAQKQPAPAGTSGRQQVASSRSKRAKRLKPVQSPEKTHAASAGSSQASSTTTNNTTTSTTLASTAVSSTTAKSTSAPSATTASTAATTSTKQTRRSSSS